MEKAGQVLGDILKKHAISKVSTLGRLADAWVGLLGPVISSHTYPSDLRDGILFLLVDSPVWMQQLSFLKVEMLEKLSGYGIADIMLRLGRVERRDRTVVKKLYVKRIKRVLSDPELQLIDNCVNGVENQDLKQHVERLIRKALEYPVK